MDESSNGANDELSVHELARQIHEGDILERREAIRKLTEYGADQPESLAPVVPDLADALSISEIRIGALVALSQLASEDPEACLPAVPDLAEVLGVTEEMPFQSDVLSQSGVLPQSNMTPTTEVDAGQPNEVNADQPNEEQYVRDIFERAEQRQQMAPELALFVLGQVIPVEPEQVTEALQSEMDTLLERLEDDHERIRGLTAGLFSYIAEHEPEVAEAAVPSLIDLLDDPEPDVRVSVVWALYYIGTDEAIEAVQRAATEDDDPAVRQTANDIIEDR